jgi:NADH-quinone oxidoreductase subunit C
MSNNSIQDIEKIINSALATKIKSSNISYNQLTINVEVENIYSTLLFLKTDTNCRFRQLVDIAGVDNPENKNRFRVVYFLLSHKNNLRIFINTNVGEKNKVPSIVNIFPSANWMEREVFDMYGISFRDHPDLRRILTDYDFKGYPLRKDFPLTGHNEVRYSEDKKKVVYESVKLEQNYRNFDFQSPWVGTKYLQQKDKEDKKK